MYSSRDKVQVYRLYTRQVSCGASGPVVSRSSNAPALFFLFRFTLYTGNVRKIAIRSYPAAARDVLPRIRQHNVSAIGKSPVIELFNEANRNSREENGISCRLLSFRAMQLHLRKRGEHIEGEREREREDVGCYLCGMARTQFAFSSGLFKSQEAPEAITVLIGRH